MTNLQAKAKMKEYLKTHFIKYHEDMDNGVSRYRILFEGYEISMIKTEILGECEPV